MTHKVPYIQYNSVTGFLQFGLAFSVVINNTELRGVIENYCGKFNNVLNNLISVKFQKMCQFIFRYQYCFAI